MFRRENGDDEVSCLICNKSTPYIFCAEHTPQFNDVIETKKWRIHVGKFKLKNYSLKKQNIVWWLGTEALALKMYPPGDLRWHIRIFFKRIRWRLFWRLFFQHWIHCEAYRNYLNCVNIKNDKICVVEHPPNIVKIEKRLHGGFNVLLYLPNIKNRNNKYFHWIYGFDILNEVQKRAKDVNFVIVDGTLNMVKWFPVIDCMISFNRIHRGIRRMTTSCLLNDIPVLIHDWFLKKDDDASIKEITEWINTKKDI